MLGFDFPVEASVNQIYKTNQDGVLFKALKISKKSKKIFGVFSDVVNKNEVFIFGIYPKIEAVENKSFKNKLSYSAFYTVSFGSFTEEIQSVTTKSTQDSPLTIGGSMNLKFHDLFSYSGSVYFSKLNSAISINNELQSNNKVVDIPWEYGLTSYLEYSGINFYLKPYTGFDYESFSTYNTDELAANTSVGLDVRTHSFLYGTVGVYGFTNFFKKEEFLKPPSPQILPPPVLGQAKFLIKILPAKNLFYFFASNIFQNWGASVLYKRHMISANGFNYKPFRAWCELSFPVIISIIRLCRSTPFCQKIWPISKLNFFICRIDKRVKTMLYLICLRPQNKHD